MAARAVVQKLFALLLVLICVLSSCRRRQTVFGAESQVQDSALTVSAALNEVSYDKKMRMRGVVSMTCPDDGCWLIMHDVANVIRVEIPEDIVWSKPELRGREIVVEGAVRRRMIARGSVGYEAYEKSCAEQSAQSRQLNPGIVVDAYRIESP